LANDYGYDQVYMRQVDALMVTGDVLLCISTSGNSANVVKAASHARACGFTVLALTGETGGELGKVAHFTVRVPVASTARVQECHIVIGHALCELVEEDVEAA
jgi:D-sedoheptulose 7-phosphate isomerase